MSQNWAELLLFICVVAQFFCLTASVTSASRMMFAFSRDGAVPGHNVWRKVARNRVPRNAVCAIGVLSGLLMVPAIWNYLVGYAAGTAIAVIGLYIAFILPVYLRFRMRRQVRRRGRGALGKHYKWIDIDLDQLGRAHLGAVHPSRSTRRGCRGRTTPRWELTNYTVLWFAGIGIFFGGWWVISAKNWFKGPVRMGTEEELEQLEEEQLGAFDLPTEEPA